MSKRLGIIAAFAAATAVGWPLLEVAVAQNLPPAAPAKNLSSIRPLPGLPDLNPTANGNTVHIMPTVRDAAKLAKAFTTPTLPLIYHSGGSVMLTTEFFPIFWIPRRGKLQDGTTSTILPDAYRNLQTRLLKDYGGHGIDNNNSQYFQIMGSDVDYIQSTGRFLPDDPVRSDDGPLGGVFVDTSPYPASGCPTVVSPGNTAGNCITDAQIQTEIQRVMRLKGWTGGFHHQFLLFTSSGEGSCNGSSCAYNQFCAYHGFINTPDKIIYANMPFANLSVCYVGQPSPNGDVLADAETTAATHEATEAITDPLLNAWFDSSGNEIGDPCNFNFGTPTWDGGLANQMWNGNFYEVQQLVDNHVGACAQVGP
jgi:hypothetical protein